ncbi:MAG: hypothetical protein CMJ27_03225 [Phycisphaerae bacterium]|nr:hypothetical protein [Phycisphaerae bacterium]OUX02746.1 MAG: hypothetical protein CBD91_01910 [Phycisphaeraceae bacterium TMED231]
MRPESRNKNLGTRTAGPIDRSGPRCVWNDRRESDGSPPPPSVAVPPPIPRPNQALEDQEGRL